MPQHSVSYVVTIYNKAAYLPGVLMAIKAELAVTGGEIILVDDGSTDQSPVLIAAFAANRTDVQIVSQPNQGVAAATNIGIATASCPYLRLVDADDMLISGSTVCLRQALETSGCGFAYGRFATEAESVSDNPAGPVSVIADPLRLMLIRQPFIPACTLGVTRIMQQALPLPLGTRTAQDFSLGLRLAAVTSFVAIDSLCCVTPVSSGGLSADKARMFRDTVILTAQFADEQEWPGRYRRLALSRNAGRARNYLRRHGGHKGRKVGAQIAGLILLAAAARMPFRWPYRRLMDYIATSYD